MIVYLKTFIHTGVYILRKYINTHMHVHATSLPWSQCEFLNFKWNCNHNFTKRTFTPSEGLQKATK